MNREALFDLIENQGNPDLPPREKTTVIFTPKRILTQLGVNGSLINEIEEASIRLQPLGSLILARKPKDNIEKSWLEGRGAYHTDIPITGDVSATVYVKGIGNEKSFDQPPGEFTGFPSQSDKLFFDQLDISKHPRELGAETTRWALMEAVNAAFVFAFVAKKQGWKHLSEAVKAGVTIPLNILHQKELSTYLYRLLQQRKNTTQGVLERQALDWEGNSQLATISLIVPGKTRIDGGLDEAVEINELIKKLTNPDIARSSGRTLRTLADMGFCYSHPSAHGQNLYTDGLMTNADSSDLATLGDYQGDRVSLFDNEKGKQVYYDISPDEQRFTLMYFQFDRTGWLTPIHHPILNPASRISWEQVIDVQTAFWKEMLSGIAKPDAIKQIAHFLPFMRTEINMAAALLLTGSIDQNQWVEMARKKREVLAGYEEEHGALTEYDNKTKDNILDAYYPHFITQLLKQKKIKAELVAQYLKSGNLSLLENDPILGKKIALVTAIEDIADPDCRDWFMKTCSDCFSSRAETGEILQFFNKGDLVARFDGQHFDLLTRLIKEKKYKDATNVANALYISQTKEVSAHYPLSGGYEIARDRYPRLLLEKGANYQEIFDRAQYDFMISSIAERTHPYDRSQERRENANGKKEEQPYSVAEYALNNQLRHPADIIKDILNHNKNHPFIREQMTKWLNNYILKIKQYEAQEVQFGKQDIAIMTELNDMVENIEKDIPELAFAHRCIFALKLTKTHPELAEAYFESAKKFYSTGLDEKLLSFIDKAKSKQTSRGFGRINLELAEQYERLGFPIIAKDYRNKSVYEFDAPVW